MCVPYHIFHDNLCIAFSKDLNIVIRHKIVISLHTATRSVAESESNVAPGSMVQELVPKREATSVEVVW